jgi:hypothetical protein
MSIISMRVLKANWMSSITAVRRAGGAITSYHGNNAEEQERVARDEENQNVLCVSL